MPSDFRQEEILFSALASRQRLSIVTLIRYGEMSVGEMASSTGLSQSALSQHLARLRAAGLVTTRRSAQSVFYRLDSRRAEAILLALDRFQALVK